MSFRRHHLDLPVQEGRARRALLGRGRAIARRTALHDVRDVRVAAPLAADRGEHVVEEAPGLSHERLALLVLVRARALADEKPRPGPRAHAEDRLLALLAKAARAAIGDERVQLFPVGRLGPGRLLRRSRRGDEVIPGGRTCGTRPGIQSTLEPVEARNRKELELLQRARVHHSDRPRKSASSRPAGGRVVIGTDRDLLEAHLAIEVARGEIRRPHLEVDDLASGEARDLHHVAQERAPRFPGSASRRTPRS